MIFRVPIGHWSIFFGEMSIQILCPFFRLGVWFFLLLSCRCSLHVLVTDPSSDIWLLNILSHATGCLFTLSVVPSEGQAFVARMKCKLRIFFFSSSGFWCQSQEIIFPKSHPSRPLALPVRARDSSADQTQGVCQAPCPPPPRGFKQKPLLA